MIWNKRNETLLNNVIGNVELTAWHLFVCEMLCNDVDDDGDDDVDDDGNDNDDDNDNDDGY